MCESLPVVLVASSVCLGAAGGAIGGNWELRMWDHCYITSSLKPRTIGLLLVSFWNMSFMFYI